MIGKLYVNGIDAFSTWGVTFEDGAYEKLLAGDSMKDYITNESRSINGVQVLIKDPRLKERDVTVTFIVMKTGTSFLSNFNNFVSVLRNGKIVEGKIYPLDIYVVDLGMTFKLIYQASISLNQANLKFGKLAVKFLEPNPASR